MILARKYFLFAMIVLSLSVGGCGLLSNIWYITFDYPTEIIASKPFFFHKKGNTEEFVVEIKDWQTHELVVLTEEEIFHTDLVYKKRPHWRIDVSVWSDGKLVERQLMGDSVAGPIFEDPSKSYKYMRMLCLGDLPSLKSSWFWNKTYTVRVEVKEIDERFTDRNLPAIVGIRPTHKL